MTDPEWELYSRTIVDCHAVADSMGPDDGLRWPFRPWGASRSAHRRCRNLEVLEG